MSDSKNFQQGSITRKLAIGIAVILVLLCGVLYFVSHKKTPAQQQAATNTTGYQATADAFVKAMSRNDGQASWNLMTANYQKNIGTESDWQKQLDPSFSKTTGSPKFVKSETQPDKYGVYKDQDPHRVTYDFTFNNVKWPTVLIILKDKTSWKVDEMSSDPS